MGVAAQPGRHERRHNAAGRLRLDLDENSVDRCPQASTSLCPIVSVRTPESCHPDVGLLVPRELAAAARAVLQAKVTLRTPLFEEHSQELCKLAVEMCSGSRIGEPKSRHPFGRGSGEGVQFKARCLGRGFAGCRSTWAVVAMPRRARKASGGRIRRLCPRQTGSACRAAPLV